MASRMAKFFSRVTFDFDTECWIFARVNYKGYGVYAGRSAHRLTYEWYIGPLSQDDDVHHLCRTRACVNPSHLEAVQRSAHAALHSQSRTHCSYGHLRSDYWSAKFNACTECHRLRSAKHRRDNYRTVRAQEIARRRAKGVMPRKARQPKVKTVRTHCRNGHLRATYWRKDCRECHRIRQNRWRHIENLTGIPARDFAECA